MTWKLEGYDTFSSESYPLGDIRTGSGGTIDGMQPSYPDYAAAKADGLKRLEDLDRTQPPETSGGQGPGGIQDRVYIVHPYGHRERLIAEVSGEA